MLLATTILGWVLATVSAITSVPQTIRLLRTKNVEGLSATTQVAWTTSWALWLSYSIEIRAWPKAGAECIGLISELKLTLMLLHVLARTRGRVPVLLVLLVSVPFSAGWLLAALLIRRHGGPEAFAVALAVFDGASLAPALHATFRAPSLDGLSLHTWVLKTWVSIGWAAYAVGIGHPLAAGWTLVMGPAAIVIVVRIIRDRRKLGYRSSTGLRRPPSTVNRPAQPPGSAATGQHGSRRRHPFTWFTRTRAP